MIYIGYYIGNKLFYKNMEGDSFKLTEYIDTDDELFLEFTTDKNEKFRETFIKRKETATRYVYNELHYFMLVSDKDTKNNIFIKNNGWVNSGEEKKTWEPLNKTLAKMLQPMISIMKKLGEELNKLDDIKKDF